MIMYALMVYWKVRRSEFSLLLILCYFIKYFVLKGQPFPSGGGDQNKNVKSMILSEDAKSILFIIENPTVVSND